MCSDKSEFDIQYSRSLTCCIAFSNMIYTKILPKLSELGYTTHNSSYMHTFRVFYGDSKYGLSVSVPPDINKNCTNNIIYDTAIWNKESNSLAYNEFIGYDDTQRFGSLDDVLKELNRVLPQFSDNVVGTYKFGEFSVDPKYIMSSTPTAIDGNNSSISDITDADMIEALKQALNRTLNRLS
jgi:hypothetical protein